VAVARDGPARNQLVGDGSGTDGEADDDESDGDGDGAADDVDADGDADADGDGAADDVDADGDGAADDGDDDEDGLPEAEGEVSGAGSALAPVVAVVTGSTVPAGVDGSKARTGMVGAALGRTGTVPCLAGAVPVRAGVNRALRGAVVIADGSPVSCTPTGRADPAPATIAQHPTATAGSAAARVSRSRRRGRASEPAARRADSAGGKSTATRVPSANSATASRHTDPGTAASGAAPMSSRDGQPADGAPAGLPGAPVREGDPADLCAAATVT
jgi:hypothetical protein